MKNILMIATFCPPMGGIGSVRISKYVKYLKEFGWEPTVVTISNEFIDNKDESLIKDIENVNIYRLQFKKKHKDISFDFYKALKKEAKYILNEKKYDMVFITGGPFGILPIGEYIYKKYGINYVIDLRDPFKLQTINSDNIVKSLISKCKRFVKGRIEKKSIKNAKYICTVNDTMTNQYKEEYPEYNDKIITISNGFDIDDYTDIEEKKLENFTIAYSGKFETAAGFRNPTNFLKILYKINQTNKIDFLHIGKDEIKIRKIVEQEKCVNYFKNTGLVSYKDAIAYDKGADILLVIGTKQKNEQTGKIFDYISCNKPIIVLADKNSEIAKVCQKFEDIYIVDYDNINLLEETILKLYNEKNKKVNRNFEQSEYSRKRLTEKLANLLNEGIGEKCYDGKN